MAASFGRSRSRAEVEASVAAGAWRMVAQLDVPASVVPVVVLLVALAGVLAPVVWRML